MLAQCKQGLPLPEVARNLGVPKSSTHCLLLTLEREGYLQRDMETRRYVFGMKIFSLANITLAGTKLREQAAPYLRALMSRTRLTVHLAIRDEDDAVVIEKIDPPGLMRLATWVGKRMDLHCTGVGKALLAYLPGEEFSRLMAKHPLPRHNENTIVALGKLREQLSNIRQVGYSFDDEEDELGLRCIGAPVVGYEGHVVGAISVAGTTSQMHQGNIADLAAQVRQTSTAISRAMGYITSR
jgi:DNA-binding IclR family transcriptional regulator